MKHRPVSDQKVYVVYNGEGIEVFTTMKDAIFYATSGQDVYNSEYEDYADIISMSSIRRNLKDWIQISGYNHMGGHFTITPTILHKRGCGMVTISSLTLSASGRWPE